MPEATDTAKLVDELRSQDALSLYRDPTRAEALVRRAAAALASANEMNERLVKALEYAALKFEEIERKALHWEKTFIETEATAARWRQIKRQAHACATEARAPLQDIEGVRSAR